MQTHSSKHILFYFTSFRFTFCCAWHEGCCFFVCPSPPFPLFDFYRKTNFANLNNINITFDWLGRMQKRPWASGQAFGLELAFRLEALFPFVHLEHWYHCIRLQHVTPDLLQLVREWLSAILFSPFPVTFSFWLLFDDQLVLNLLFFCCFSCCFKQFLHVAVFDWAAQARKSAETSTIYFLWP